MPHPTTHHGIIHRPSLVSSLPIAPNIRTARQDEVALDLLRLNGLLDGPHVRNLGRGLRRRVFNNAIYSYSGVENMTVAAAETRDPRRAIPKAARRIFARVLLFYVLSIFMVGLVVPSNDPNLFHSNENRLPLALHQQRHPSRNQGGPLHHQLRCADIHLVIGQLQYAQRLAHPLRLHGAGNRPSRRLPVGCDRALRAAAFREWLCHLYEEYLGHGDFCFFLL